MAVATMSNTERQTLTKLLEGPLTRMNLGATSALMLKLEQGGFIKRAGVQKGQGRPGILYKLTDKGRKRAR